MGFSRHRLFDAYRVYIYVGKLFRIFRPRSLRKIYPRHPESQDLRMAGVLIIVSQVEQGLSHSQRQMESVVDCKPPAGYQKSTSVS